jgi:glycosyltransferase involved in cell wall biosynthesis
MSEPTVSIVMPVFNAERYLPAAVASVRAQTFGDFELVAVDDGSTDQSGVVLADAAAADARVRVITQGNAGGTAAMQAGVEASRGRYLARFDADDLMHPARLERQVAYLDDHPEVVALGSWVRLIDGRGRLLKTLPTPIGDADIQRDLLKGHTAIFHPSVVVRAEAMRTVGGYDPHFKLAQDLDLFLRLGEVGRLANLPVPLIDYRLHANSVSEQKTAVQRGFVKDAVERAWARRGITDGVLEHTQDWRPGKDRGSRARFACQYGWWAWSSGERRTAAAYGLSAVRATPWRPEPWKLLTAALIKTPPPPDRPRPAPAQRPAPPPRHQHAA